MGHETAGGAPPARLDAESAAAVAETLQALVTPSRLLILSELRHRPATVSELTVALALEQSAVSHQLRLLRMMGMVTATRHGRSITYSLFDHHVAALLDEAVFHAEHVRLGIADEMATDEGSDPVPAPKGYAS
jgi:ArsR family transcriptional regulator, nickel/cobalt-responsive transcriptional repressor